jgi:hypothetical protein
MSKFSLNDFIKINDETNEIIKYDNNGNINDETISSFFEKIFSQIFEEEISQTDNYWLDKQYFKGQYPYYLNSFDIEIHYTIHPTSIEISVSSFIPGTITSWGRNEKICNNRLDKIKSVIKNTLNSIKEKKIEEEKIEKTRVEKLNTSKLKVLTELDKDNNGEVDLIDGESFNKLLNKNQKSISEIDKNYIQKFVKISMYLKTKKSNTQKIFDSIKDTKNDKELNELVNLLKNQIHTYDILVFHSISMITSLVESDLISFYEIYECFDQLGVFNSNWENDVSGKLSNIGEGIKDLMYSIYHMEQSIVNSLDNLSYVTQDSFQDLRNSIDSQLSSIDSSIQCNNLLTGIQTYQMYKINQNTKRIG